MSKYTMHRRGTFRAAYVTENQCAFPGAEKYTYRVTAHFPSNSHLNAKHFLIDHQDIDDVVHSLKLAGSCEQMERQITHAIVSHLFTVGLKPTYVHLEVGDSEGDGLGWQAWMEYEWTPPTLGERLHAMVIAAFMPPMPHSPWHRPYHYDLH